MPTKPIIQFGYTNHRGETAKRTITVDAVEYVHRPGYDYEPGWFVSGWCHDRQARRSFALSKIDLGDSAPHAFKLMVF